MRYDAFVSYSHAADDLLAPRLQEGLARLAKPWWRRRSLRVFRDRTGLSANPGLWSSIESAIDDSKWFILLASPESSESPWVEREVSHWLATREADRFLVVVTGGSWRWDPERNDFARESTAVPQALVGVFDEEPRHIDISWARSEAQLDIRNGRFRDAVAELAAPLHGLAKDDLEGMDLREHRRTIRWAWSVGLGFLVLALVASVAGTVAVRKADEASEAKRSAQTRAADAQYQRLVAQARNQIGVDRELAFLLALEANRLRDEPESRSVLLAALQAERHFLGPEVVSVPPWSGGAIDDRWVLYGTRDARVGRVNIDDGSLGELRRLGGEGVGGIDVADDPTRNTTDPMVVLRRDTGQIWQLDPVTLEAVGPAIETGGPALCLAASRRLGVVSVCSTDGTVAVIDLFTGAPRYRVGAPLVTNDSSLQVDELQADETFAAAGATLTAEDATGVAFSPTTDTMAVSRAGGAVELHSIAGRPLVTVEGNEANYYVTGELIFAPDGSSLVQSDFTGVDQLRSIDPATGVVRWATSLTDQYSGGAVSVLGDGTLAVATSDGRLGIVDAATGARVREVGSLPAGQRLDIFATLDRRLVVLDGQRPTMWIYSTDGDGALVRVLGNPGQLPFEISPSGRRLVAWEGDGPVFYDNSLWDIETGQRLIERLPVGRSIPLDDTTLVAFYDDLTAGRYDTVAGRRLEPSIPFDPLAWTMLTWNLPAGLIAVGYPDRVEVFDASAGRPLDLPAELNDPVPTKLEFDDAGTLATVYDGSTVTVRDLSTGELRFGPVERVWDLAHDDDGTLYLSGTDGRIEHRDLDSGTLLRRYARQGRPADLRIGRNLLVAARIGEWTLYDIESGAQVGDRFEIAQTAAGYSNGAITPDGRRLVVAGEQGMEVWDLRLERWRSAACELAGRNLTPAERDRYLPDDARRRPTC